MNQLILIAVPGSTDDGAPVVRVVATPRLESADTVAATPLADWPTALASATFEINVDGRTVPASPIHEGDSAIWHEFFSNLPVASAPAPVIGDPPVVRPTAADAAAVEATYRTVSTVDIDPTAVDQPVLDESSAKELRDHWQRPPLPEGPSTAVAAPPVEEFHQVVGLLREHPAVMRRLGLIFDLPIADPAALAGSGVVAVTLVGPPAGLEPVSVPSRYELDADRGLVPGRSLIARAGCLDLSLAGQWATTTFEVDGAVDRLTAAATDLAQDDEGSNTARLPALRSAGIQLLRPGRKDDFTARRAAIQRNTGRDQVDQFEPLTADDLTLGYRVDVRPRGGQWSSLMRRTARYLVNDVEIVALDEEGHLKAGAAVAQGTAMVATELVARWSGWSLAVAQAHPTGRRNNLPFTFTWEHDVVPGSLLPLRFGRGYHLRIRLADLAGAGVPAVDSDQTMGTSSIPYSRCEPVGSPVVSVTTPGADLGPGGDIDQLVVRADAPDYPDNNARELLPPTVSLDLAVQHGMLDGAAAETFSHVERAFEQGLADPASGGVMVFPVPEPGGSEIRPEPAAWPGSWPDVGSKTLRLRPRNGAEARLATLPDAVEVRLAPGEQVTLALSSLVTEDFLDHLTVSRWRGGGADDSVVADGRHPMATPSRRVTLIHAARRQPEAPSGSLSPAQEPGAISATLSPQPGLLGADPAFTQQLQVVADWTEAADAEDLPMTGVAIANLSLVRGDTQLPPIVHSFGDTRHRLVRYTLACVSRFRAQYRPDEDAERFIARGELDPVSIRSTSRPAPPAVRAVVPGLPWQRKVAADGRSSIRQGGVLRVELERPWRMTGVGEQLAVLIGSIEAGRDPAVTTADLPRRLSASDFPAGAVSSVESADGQLVEILPVDVSFAGDRWVADVHLPRLADISYRPFVSMRVARYQSESLAGLELSDSVATDPIQLLPERRLTVRPSAAGSAEVLLEGIGPQPPNVVVITVEEPGGQDTDLVAAEGDGHGLLWRVVATLSAPLGAPQLVQVSPTARLRVREVETFAASRAEPLDELGQRTVFTEVITAPVFG